MKVAQTKAGVRARQQFVKEASLELATTVCQMSYFIEDTSVAKAIKARTLEKMKDDANARYRFLQHDHNILTQIKRLKIMNTIVISLAVGICTGMVMGKFR